MLNLKETLPFGRKDDDCREEEKCERDEKYSRKDDDCDDKCDKDDKWSSHDKYSRNDDCDKPRHDDCNDDCPDMHAVLASMSDVGSVLDFAVGQLDTTSTYDTFAYDDALA